MYGCPFCHGYELGNDGTFGLISFGRVDTMLAGVVARFFSKKTIVFANGVALTAEQRASLEAKQIEIVEGVVERVVASRDNAELLEAVHMADGRVIAVRALFYKLKRGPVSIQPA